MANEFKVKNGLIVSGSADIEQDLRVRGTLTVDEFHTSITTSSIIYESGSTRFGNSLDDIHGFTGSVNITGSISLNGQAIGTGKLDETVFNAYTSSYKVSTASFNDLTSSYNSFTTSYISDSSSFNTRIGGLETFSSSLDTTFVNEVEFGTFSSSIKNFTSSLNSYTNSLENRLGIIESSTSSLNTYTSSTNTRLNSFESTTSSLNSFSSSTNSKLSAIETSTGSLNSFSTSINSFTSSINTTIKNKLNNDGVISGSSQILNNSNIVSSSLQVTAYGFAITGSNTFKGDQLISGSIIPTIDNAFDLGSPTSQWRDVYISSGSLYIDNTKVLSSTAQELVITTDTGQSIKILEGTTDSIILQTADGDIELKSSADGDILLDPTNGKIMLKGPIEVLNGNKIQSSVGGTPVVFASDIVVSGSIDITGTIEGIDLTAFSSSLNSRLGSLESSGGSLNTFTASAISRLNSIESSTSSLNTYTSSNNTRLGVIETSTGSLNSFTSSANSRLNSIESTTSSLNTYTNSANTKFNNIESVTSSFASYSGSTNTRLNNIETSTGSLNSFTSSTNSKISTIETSTSSLNSFTSSINTTIKNRLNTENVISGSVQVTLSNTTGYSTFSSSLATTDAGQDSKIASLEGKTGSYATTGSNIFIGNQTITGSLYISQDLVIAGSSSIQHISSSVVNIDDNIITVNAQNPSIRFGGLAVIDSGSSPQVSGSMLFDSVNDQWIFVHQNQSTVTSSILLMGPQTFNNLGNETYPTTNRILKSLNAEHIGDSNITDTGTKVSINSNTEVTGSIKSTSYITAETNLVSNFSSGDEGGEINLNKPVTNTTLSSGITIDVWRDRVRIFESGGTNRGGFFNIAGLSTGAGTNFLGTAETASFVEYTNVANKPTLVSGSSQINHNATTNYDANQHVDHTAVSITAGNGLSGGGTIASTRTLTLDTGSTHFTNGVKSKMNTDGVVSGSSQITYSSISGIPSGIVSGSSQVLNGTTIHSGSFFNGITVVSGSGQISFNGITDKPTLVSGSSQITYSGLSGIPSGIVSGSSQITYGSISGIPGGIVSGSAQIDLTATTNYSSGIKTRLNAEGVVSGSVQVSFGSISGVPSGLVSGSSQISIASTTGFSTYLDQAVKSGSTVTFGGLTVNSSSVIANNTSINPSGYTNSVVAGAVGTGGWGIVSGLGGNAGTNMNWGMGHNGSKFYFGLSNGSAALSTWMEVSPSKTITMNGYTTNGFVKFTNSDGTLAVDTTTYYSSSSQVSLTGTTGFGTYLNQAVLTSSSPSFAGITSTAGITVSGTAYYTFNKPSTASYQTVALFGSTTNGIFLTSDSGIISRGAYFNGGWIATDTYGAYLNFNTSTGGMNLHVFSGATVGGAASTTNIFTVARNDFSFNGNTIWHAGNDGAGSGLDADLLDGYSETSFIRIASSSSSPTNGTFAIGSASGRNFIQSHNSQPLDINPLGNTVFVNGNQVVTNTGSWGINITGNAATVTNGVYTTGDQTISGTKTFGVIRGDSGSDYPHSFTNTDSGNTHWTNRGNRLLTSNGTNWVGDGRDPIMALVGSTSLTTRGRMIGLTLHNDDSTDNAFSPMLTFSSKSNSGGYNTVYASISGRKTGYVTGVDTNWSKGELHFYCHGDSYVADTPTLRMTATNATFNTSLTVNNGITAYFDGSISLRLDSSSSSSENDLRFAKAGTDYGAIQTNGSTHAFEFYVNTDGSSGGWQRMLYMSRDSTESVFDRGTVRPGANGTQNLGTSSFRWATVFTSDLSLSNGIGDYTIVEGEEKLYLYNNKNNKVYSFVLQEEDPATATPKKS